VVVVDDLTGSPADVVALAEQLAPFPANRYNYYPGVRRIITEADTAAFAYVERLCQDAAPFIAGAFDVDGFDLLEASFSMVTTPPSALSRPQRSPHFDSTDPKYFALLHYLRVPPGTGTAFFRQRSTGIERVTDANIARFVPTAERDSARLAPGSGYIGDSNAFFEQVAAVEAVADRLLIYQGGLLHSGLIPADMKMSADPREGRLTANIFVRGR
jgi:hypothetical protein